MVVYRFQLPSRVCVLETSERKASVCHHHHRRRFLFELLAYPWTEQTDTHQREAQNRNLGGKEDEDDDEDEEEEKKKGRERETKRNCEEREDEDDEDARATPIFSSHSRIPTVS